MQNVALKTITHPPKRKQWNEMTLCRFNKITVLISLITTMCLWNIRHKWNGFFPLVLSYIRFFLYSSLFTGLVTRIIRRKPLPEQELPNVPENLSSPPDFSGVHVARTFVFCFVFYRSLFDVLNFFFWQLCCLSFKLFLIKTVYIYISYLFS